MISWFAADARPIDVDHTNVLAWNPGSSIWTRVTPAGAEGFSVLLSSSAAC